LETRYIKSGFSGFNTVKKKNPTLKDYHKLRRKSRKAEKNSVFLGEF